MDCDIIIFFIIGIVIIVIIFLAAIIIIIIINILVLIVNVIVILARRDMWDAALNDGKRKNLYIVEETKDSGSFYDLKFSLVGLLHSVFHSSAVPNPRGEKL